VNEAIVKRLDAALAEENPELGLHYVVRELLTEGNSRLEIVDLLEEYRGVLEEQGRDASIEDDLVIDIIAVLAGFASKTAVRNLIPPPCKAPHAVNLS
jgi:hypothetical protein